MANANITARIPTTTNRKRADDIAKMNTRKTFDGKLVARVEEVSSGVFAVLVDHVVGNVRKPYGVASV